MHILTRISPGLAIVPCYFLVAIALGWLARRQGGDANAYLHASRSLPLLIVTAAYLAANCGALEIVGLSAMAAQYGVQAFHFYWIGAIPAMVFLALWMMPVYRRSGIRSVPQYLEVRYGPSVRLLNACVLAVTILLLAGISLYAMAQVLQVAIGLNFSFSVALSAGVVLIYVLLGGIRATIYNEVFQLLVILVGLVPLAVRCFHLSTWTAAGEGMRDHLWAATPVASRAAPLDRIGIVFGLGFVLSFGYWCTDFVLMQRAFTARTESDARQVPLWAGFGKILFSFVVVLPGLAAYRLIPGLGHVRRFDQAMPALMTVLYGPIMLGFGFTALIASLMSGLSANVSAFAAIWTEDIYKARLFPRQRDAHYLLMGRLAAVVAILISALASYLNFFFSDLMEHIQLIFSVFGSPFFALFLFGMGSRRINARGAVIGFISGIAVALLHLAALTSGWLHYGSIMSADFYSAIYAFGTTAIVSWIVSGTSRSGDPQPLTGLVFEWRSAFQGRRAGLLWVLSISLLLTCALMNVIWR